ncbi:hypothetical protein ST47_g4332 [Ascochyta rabiei]|uniref:Uncharacterized protein n=1 Tax=Didymella rabiei TaxID=5454 RepID=A0A163FY72_DIDRA|nr:hypothetical protein ST47_g4332 [Ascochyta rabiei]
MRRAEQEEQLELPIDFHAGLYCDLLDDIRFRAWKQIRRRWQLHINGGPGSGKTTLGIQLARHLQDEGRFPIILLHVHDYKPPVEETATLCSLRLLHNEAYRSKKFTKSNEPIIVSGLDSLASNSDSQELHKTLARCLYESNGCYLIIDGLDKCQESIQNQMFQGLSAFEAQGLRVLVLRGAPELQPFDCYYYCCDNCQHSPVEADGLQIYWQCSTCNYHLCDPCKSIGMDCSSEHLQMIEPYKTVNIELAPNLSGLEKFVQLDLRREFGQGVGDEIIEDILGRSEGNINLAKLRLDHIRDSGSPRDVLSVKDRLPREIIAFFDTEIQSVSIGDPMQRYQALIALVTVAEKRYVSVFELEQVLGYTDNSEPGPIDESYPYVHRALNATHGMLRTTVWLGRQDPSDSELDRHKVTLYTEDLYWYIRDDYNEDLTVAKQSLHLALREEETLNRSDSLGQVIGTDKTDVAKIKCLKGELGQPRIVNAILSDPGPICEPCKYILFESEGNSGYLTCFDCVFPVQCPICSYMYKEMKDNTNTSSGFRWSRRTMGRASNVTEQLSVNLKRGGFGTTKLERTFIFMLKSELSLVPNSNDLRTSTHLGHTGTQIRSWLQTCQDEHDHCGHRTSNSYVPKRLVDVDTGIEGLFRIIPKADKRDGPYVTLSHCWGRSPNFLALTTNNMERLMGEGFLSSDLRNRNFDEAIQVAKHLGVRYIWIDSLCICQAGKKMDFSSEGQYMHLVYQHSLCNIVVADSENGDGGLFRLRPPKSLLGTSMKQSWVILEKDLWDKELLQSPIYKRGWVFQERMLSPRIVHFTRSEVFWDCSAVSACESLPHGIPLALSATATTDRGWRGRLQRQNSNQKAVRSTTEDSLESFWKSAILNYTSCELTNQSDKTLAIWSVAKLVRDQLELEDEYGCGLWANALHEQLAWQVEITKREARMDSLQAIFPSWSWASVNAPIQLRDRIVEKRSYTIKSHERNRVSFNEFVDKATPRDRQPKFAASQSLAICGYLIPGHVSQNHLDFTYKFEYTTAATPEDINYFKVTLDEVPILALLAVQGLQFLPLVARKINDEGSAYSGTGLVLIANHDFRQLTQSKLRRRIVELASLYRPRISENRNSEDCNLEMRRLRGSIQLLDSWLREMKKKDQEKPNLAALSYRRLGAVQFSGLAAEVWDEFRNSEERRLWLD